MAIIISSDQIKETIAGYTPSKAELFHSQSAKLADKQLAQVLKGASEKTVILMAGGSASGKTEYVSAHLKHQRVIVVDGTLPTLLGASIKIKNIIKSGKKVQIHLVVPNFLFVAFQVFLNRSRKFPSNNFYRTHSKSRTTVYEIAQQYPDIDIKIFISQILDTKPEASLQFSEGVFSNRQDMIEYLKRDQYTQEVIKHKIIKRDL